jgi:ABC-2 type transport system permease protein
VNVYAIRAIYMFERARWFRTLFQSIASPVISTSLYFIVFGGARTIWMKSPLIRSRMNH